MRLSLYAALSIAGLCLMAACELMGLGGADENRTLVGPTWRLVAFEDASGNQTKVETRSGYADTAYTVVFTNQSAKTCAPEQHPQGNWCIKTRGYPNEGFFSYERKKNQSLKIYFHGATQVGLPPGSKERSFFTALDAATSYRINSNRLRIAYDGGKALLFEAKASESD